ncbi:MAG: nucleotidyltransferase domain-containing protein [Candidatus Hydrogenedentes bacterium]|nr:nucleotidyltransferase domain-containing protein [Candidatus Hydrogenedentota bacterium]
MLAELEIDRELLEAVCKRWHIKKLSIFGSALRDDFRPDSDVDVLIEFDPEHIPGWEIVDVGDDLSKAFGGRYVDMVSPKYVIPALRARILTSAVVQYEAADGKG